MGIIARRFAKAFCKDEAERKEEEKRNREELQSRMQAHMEKRQLEKEKMKLLPPLTKRNLKCAKVFLGVLCPLSAIAVLYNILWGVIASLVVGIILSITVILCKWKNMVSIPLLSVCAGILLGLLLMWIWRG